MLHEMQYFCGMIGHDLVTAHRPSPFLCGNFFDNSVLQVGNSFTAYMSTDTTGLFNDD